MFDSIKSFFKLIYRYWMKFAHVLGWVNTRVILSVFYLVILTPVGLLLKVFKKDLLEEKINPAESTYWLVKEQVVDRERYLKPY